MKKGKLFLLTVAAAALASCTNDELTEVNTGKAIGFRLPAVTRASETTTQNLTDFNVTALNSEGETFFSGVTFSKSEDFFNSNHPYFWPTEGRLNFYAWAPTSLNVNISSTNKTVEFKANEDISSQVDFIVAAATGSKQDNETSGVSLTFQHALSQIAVKAKNTNTNYTFKAKQVKICNVYSKGKFMFFESGGLTDGSWVEWESKLADYEFDAIYPVQLNATEATSLHTAQGEGNAMLVPQKLTAYSKYAQGDGTYLAVMMDINTKDGANVYPTTAGKYAWVAVPIDTNWEAGKKYTYILEFGQGGGLTDPEKPDGGQEIFGEPIKFEVEVSPWDETSPAGDQEIDV